MSSRVGQVPSPDGSRVAYEWYTSNFTFEVRLIGLNGAEPEVVHQAGGPLAWSPDGRYLAARPCLTVRGLAGLF